jgi:hypothetical protein
MQALTLFFAESVRYEASGKVLAVGMYFNVKLQGSPSDNVGEVCIYTTLTGVPPGHHTVRVAIIAADEDVVMEPDGLEFESKGENQIYPAKFIIPDFMFPASGNYSYHVLIDDEEVAGNVLSVKFEHEEPVAINDAENVDTDT